MYIEELGLEDLLADPLTRLMMASDGVEADDIRALARQVAGRADAPVWAQVQRPQPCCWAGLC